MSAVSDDINDDEINEELPLMKLPLDAWHRSLGARIVPFAGYEMPVQYEGVMAEHLWTRSDSSLFDVSHMGQIQLIGKGATEALEALVPGNISGLGVGKMRYTLLLEQDGGIVDDLMVTNLGEYLYLVVNGATKHDDIGYLREYLPDDITINYMEDFALLALQGPKSEAALTKLDIKQTGLGVEGPEALYFMEAAPFFWNDVPLSISRSGYTGEDGFEISLPSEHVEEFAKALTALDEVRPAGLGARDSLRLEAGLPLYGHDMTIENLPVEAGLSFALSKVRREAANFAGADIVLAQYPDKVPRKRVALSVDAKQPVREGALLENDEAVVIGVVTSGGFSPTLQRPIAMGYISNAHIKASVVAVQRGKKIACTITNAPFVPHKYHRKPKA